MKRGEYKPSERYSPEVLERLPYWVREMLEMLEEAGDESKEDRTPQS